MKDYKQACNFHFLYFILRAVLCFQEMIGCETLFLYDLDIVPGLSLTIARIFSRMRNNERKCRFYWSEGRGEK